MLKDIVSVQQPLRAYQLYIRFEDGAEGVQPIQFSGVFAPLQDPECFTQVRVHPELGTVIWDNGVDLDPDVLYAIITGQPILDYESGIAASN